MRRIGSVDDIAAAVAYLASDDASYVTGQEIVVDGGFLVRTGQPTVTNGPSSSAPQGTPTIAIVGAGMGGISAGVLLRKAGIDDVHDLRAVRAGRWYVVGQPVPRRRGRRRLVHLFVSVQALRLDAHPRTPGGDPRATSRRRSSDFGLAPHLRFGIGVQRAVWDDDRHVYDSRSRTAKQTECHVLISAVGFLNVPYYPDWPGLRRLPRPDLPHLAVGARARPHRQDGRHRGHRIDRVAARPRAPADRRQDAPLPARARAGCCRRVTATTRRRSAHDCTTRWCTGTAGSKWYWATEKRL